MGYTKNSWQSGDIITKTKLDNMEDGIYGAYPLVISVTRGEDDDSNTTWTMDKTYAEIVAAVAAGRLAYVYSYDQLQLVYDISNNTVSAYYFYNGDRNAYIAATENDYPVRTVIAP